MESNVRVVSFMGDQRSLCEDLYRCKETRKIYIRQESGDDNHVRWLTSSKWTEGYEADCPMKAGLILRVVDKAGSVLFEEELFQEEGVTGTWAEKKGPFSWEAVDGLAKEIAKKYELCTLEEWEAWLLADMPEGAKIYPENWLFGMANRQPPKKLARMDFLGIKVFAISQEEEHTACGKAWVSYEIRDADLSSCLSLCGFKYGKE